jgi:hypothetical protein
MSENLERGDKPRRYFGKDLTNIDHAVKKYIGKFRSRDNSVDNTKIRSSSIQVKHKGQKTYFSKFKKKLKKAQDSIVVNDYSTNGIKFRKEGGNNHRRTTSLGGLNYQGRSKILGNFIKKNEIFGSKKINIENMRLSQEYYKIKKFKDNKLSLKVEERLNRRGAKNVLKNGSISPSRLRDSMTDLLKRLKKQNLKFKKRPPLNKINPKTGLVYHKPPIIRQSCELGLKDKSHVQADQKHRKGSIHQYKLKRRRGVGESCDFNTKHLNFWTNKSEVDIYHLKVNEPGGTFTEGRRVNLGNIWNHLIMTQVTFFITLRKITKT